MNERIRIYELARQMNLPNQDLITALRELGYDVKSHSSTIEGNVVGMLITALGKKKHRESLPLPLNPPRRKQKLLLRQSPLSLSRASYHAANQRLFKLKVPNRWQNPLPNRYNQLCPPAPPEPPPPPKVHPARIQPLPPATEEERLRPRIIRPGANLDRHVEHKPLEVPAAKVEEIAEPAAAELQKLDEQEDAKTLAAPVEEEKQEQEEQQQQEEEVLPGFEFPGFSTKPAAPSQPTRIAAPSIRATPPRPPKSHRQAPTERHGHLKKDDKARQAAATLEVPKIVVLNQDLTVKELAAKMAVSDTEVIKRLFIKGFMRTVNQLVELEMARISPAKWNMKS